MQISLKRYINSILFGLGLAASLSAQASIVQLTNESQMTTSFVNNFESVANAGPVNFVSGNLVSASSYTSNVTSSGSRGFASISYGSSANITALLSGSFNSVGMYFGNDDRCCASRFSSKLSIFSGANFLGSVSVLANMNDYADQFIGLSSSVAFDKVVIDYSGVSLYVYIDDFRLGSVSTQVPEPTSLALMGLALAGLCATRRQIRRSI